MGFITCRFRLQLLQSDGSWQNGIYVRGSSNRVLLSLRERDYTAKVRHPCWHRRFNVCSIPGCEFEIQSRGLCDTRGTSIEAIFGKRWGRAVEDDDEVWVLDSKRNARKESIGAKRKWG